jgi:RNA polymerase subunit RPABC4/transcription elongation factor Spt4
MDNVICDNIKICTNCGEKLLIKARICPTCGKNAKDFPIVNSSDNEKIDKIISSVPNPQKRENPNWHKRCRINNQQRLNSESQNVVCCPKCHSTSLLTSKKGFSIGFAIFGCLFFGAIGGLLISTLGIIIGIILGILCGFESSRKIRMTCLKCGHKFYPGKK